MFVLSEVNAAGKWDNVKNQAEAMLKELESGTVKGGLEYIVNSLFGNNATPVSFLDWYCLGYVYSEYVYQMAKAGKYAYIPKADLNAYYKATAALVDLLKSCKACRTTTGNTKQYLLPSWTGTLKLEKSANGARTWWKLLYPAGSQYQAAMSFLDAKKSEAVSLALVDLLGKTGTTKADIEKFKLKTKGQATLAQKCKQYPADPACINIDPMAPSGTGPAFFTADWWKENGLLVGGVGALGVGAAFWLARRHKKSTNRGSELVFPEGA
jgi:hypothetical protein